MDPALSQQPKLQEYFSPVSRHKNQKGTGNVHLLIQYKQVHLQQNIFFGWSQNVVQKFFGCQTAWNSPWLLFSPYGDKWQSDVRGWKRKLVQCQERGHGSRRKWKQPFLQSKLRLQPQSLAGACPHCHHSTEVSAAVTLSAAEHWLATALPRGLKACGKVPTVNLRWYLRRWRRNSLFPLRKQKKLYL